MQGEAKCDKTGDRNAATEHNTDQDRDTHSHRGSAAHHRRSAIALIRRQNRTKQRQFASTEARLTTQPCLHGTHDAQVTPPTSLMNQCTQLLQPRLKLPAMNFSGMTYLNTQGEETIVPWHTYRGGGEQLHIPDEEPGLGPYNDLYTPFSGSGHEWLSNNQILKCVLYMLHMQYPDAKHQNMGGVTHPVPSVQELLHKVKQADGNSPLEYSTDFLQAMRDALSPDGPSPAITRGDNTHWRVMLINARRKHVDFIDPFGTGFLHSVRTSIQNFYERDKTGTWTFTEWTKRLQPRGDTWNCAIWIQEKWMQYWSHTEATEAFADWLEQDVDMIPEGQDLRQHYHVVMQIAGTAGEDGMTDIYKAREISASRMANHRNKQALHETYKAHMREGANNKSGSRGNIPSKQAVSHHTPLHKSYTKGIIHLTQQLEQSSKQQRNG